MSLKIANEVKLETDPCALAWDNKLFVGTEDGSIKVSDFCVNLNNEGKYLVNVY